MSDAATPTTGTDLKVARVRAGIKAYRVAESMGVSAWTVSRLERPLPVADDVAVRYLLALERCRSHGGKAA